MTKFKILAASIIAATAAASVPAAAENLTITKQLVEHGDLDLSSAKGQARLEQRIKSAVRAVCGNNNSRTLAETQIVQNCQKQARTEAMGKALVAIARYKEGRQLAVRDATIVGN